MNHYTYRIHNTKTNKSYIGDRSCQCKPKEDLGIKYFSSSSDKDFMEDQLNNPSDYNYWILDTFDTREEAKQLEIDLHNFHDVGRNPKFYNKAKQTSVKFDTTGTSPWNKNIPRSKNTKLSISNTLHTFYNSKDGLKNKEASSKRQKQLFIDEPWRVEEASSRAKKYQKENGNPNLGIIRPKEYNEKQSSTMKQLYIDEPWRLKDMSTRAKKQRNSRTEKEQAVINKKMAASLKGLMAGGKNGMAKPISIDGKEYACVMDAVREKDISRSKIDTRLKSEGYPNYQYM